MKKIIVISMLYALCSMLFSSCGPKPQFMAVGDEAPGFSILDMNGNKVSLKSLLNGKEVVLNFWASWCPECRAEVSRLKEFSEKYKDKIEIVGINLEESKETVQSFIESNGIKYKILLDSNGKTAKLYMVRGVPTNILINKDGLIKKLNIDIREMESYLIQI
ncbi:MAG: TlpA disulfide reductase family protein [bacterium]|nr:TlpA disulfide reductase family protein [bacterium]